MYIHIINKQEKKNVLGSDLFLELGTFKIVVNVAFIIPDEAI